MTERQRIVVDLRPDKALIELEAASKSIFELDAGGDRRVDGDVNETQAIGARDQPVRLDAWDAQTFSDFALR